MSRDLGVFKLSIHLLLDGLLRLLLLWNLCMINLNLLQFIILELLKHGFELVLALAFGWWLHLLAT